MSVIEYPHIEFREGVPFVKGSRITVYTIYRRHREGLKIEVICQRHRTLTISQVLTALAFAYDNPTLMVEPEEKR